MTTEIRVGGFRSLGWHQKRLVTINSSSYLPKPGTSYLKYLGTCSFHCQLLYQVVGLSSEFGFSISLESLHCSCSYPPTLQP